MNSTNWSERRLHPRFVMSGERPVYVRAIHDDQEIHMLVENLSMGGALLMCPAVYGSLQNGQCLHDAELILSEAGSPRVNLNVRWQFWPRIGVQFDALSAAASSQISQLLEEQVASLAD